MALRDSIPWRKVRRGGEEPLLPQRREVAGMLRETFEDFYRPWSLAPWGEVTRRLAGFAPAVDVSETGDEYRVSVELPGLSKDDVELTIDAGRLLVRGEKKSEERQEKESYLRVERSYGSFSRSIPLPESVDQDAVEATFNEGVLTVRLPKTEKEHGKRVEIKGE